MAANGMAEGRLVAPADTAWWRMEQADNQMAITAVMVFDGRLDFEHLHYVIATRLLKFDRFRERISEPGIPLASPAWVRDEDFNLDHHLCRKTLPAPGGRRELERLVGDLMSAPLDYRRPLWCFTLVDGFEGGSVVVARFHHCIADGIALVDLLLHLDDEPGHEVPPIAPYRPLATGGNGTGGLLGLPFRLASSGIRVGGSALGVAGKLLSMGTDAKSPLRGSLSSQKRAAWSPGVKLEAIKEAARHFEGTVNDIIASSVAGSLHDFLKERMRLPADMILRAVVPVNLRSPSDYGTLGNRFGLIWLPLPVGIADPLERLQVVKRAMDHIKRTPEAHMVYGLLGLFGRTTRTAVHLAVQFLARGATLVFTNVPGPREPIHFCGRRMTECMAWVPQSGRLGLGISAITYDGELRLGVATDASLVAEPALLVDAYHRSLDGILDYAGARVPLSAAV